MDPTLLDDRADAGPAHASSGADRWLAIVHAGIATFRTHAFHQVSPELVASAAGVDLEVLTEQFPTMDDVIAAVVQVWNGQRMEPILPIAQTQGAVAFLRAIMVANVADPALMRVLTAIVNIAATPDHPMAPLLQRQWLQFHAHVQRTLVRDIEVGREPDTMDPARGAEQLIAMYEGLQLQSMVRPHMDVLGAWDRAVTRLRDGWSRTYTPPTWTI